eukprot:TRINITY_DN1131_c0_g1_i2.p1 TRINITY_DN1131_c0_g1~~TRINITY_DN1131_c0_g1_i2.p1  ORF type:complete len:346 (-),score=57.53 TRINITY_DN1131_c0_g1_i2:192-1229(-)
MKLILFLFLFQVKDWYLSVRDRGIGKKIFYAYKNVNELLFYLSLFLCFVLVVIQVNMSLNLRMQFQLPKFGGKKAASPTKTIKKPTSTPKKSATVKKPAPSGTVRTGGAGYRKFAGDALWLPNTNRPDWLDGSLPGDRGFDPLGLGKPTEYLQVDVDAQDINAAVNKAGNIIGAYQESAELVSEENRLQPYKDVFGLERFRECELIHGRWAMLACLGCVVAEGVTGVSWVEAGKVELDGAQYFNLALPFSITQLVWIEVILVGGAEIYRNTELDPVKRCYPGGIFDPLKLASDDSERSFRLKEAEIKHARLAMLAFLGYAVQAGATGQGALGSLSLFAKNLSGAV